jgi:hypothetical protein
MRSRCCLCVRVCLCISPIVARQQLGKNPFIGARQRLGRNLTAVTKTHAIIEELLDASFSMWPVSYQGMYAITSSQNFFFQNNESRLKTIPYLFWNVMWTLNSLFPRAPVVFQYLWRDLANRWFKWSCFHTPTQLINDSLIRATNATGKDQIFYNIHLICQSHEI